MLLTELQTYSLTHIANVPFSTSSSGDNSFCFITEKGLDVLAGVGKTGLLRLLTCLLLVTSLAPAFADDVTQQVFGDRTDGLPAAFGDFNSDELTDLFVIQNNGRTLEILLQDQDKEPTMKHAGLKCNFTNHITSVVPGDFNGDALMDVMVTLMESNDGIHQVVVLWGEITQLKCNKEVLFKTRGQPLAIDYDSNMIIDLFGLDENHNRSFWLFNQNKTKPEQIFMKQHNNYMSSIRNPHSHAFLDLTGDDLADLYITTEENFEIWKGSDDVSVGFTPWKIIPQPTAYSRNKQHVIGQTVFMDVELKGKLDHLVPVCLEDSSPTVCTIYVYFNETWHDLKINLHEDGTSNLWLFPNGQLSQPYLETITLRVGDFNMDGYPDLLGTLVCNPKTKNEQFKSFILQNVPCKTTCSEFSRTFEVQWNRLSPFNNNTIMGVFYDFQQNGVLDVIFVHNNLNQMYNVSAYHNTLDYDAYFVKVMVVTGLSNPDHPLDPGPLRKSASVYGTNLPGPKISYLTTTQEGDPKTAVATQIPQSAHHSLNLPYTIFGLGRTPNFIDSLTVQMYGNDRQWTQLIPNSQMVVIPWPIREPNSWKVQLFVTPSKLIVQSVLALLATCVVIAAIIGVLYWKERKEDHLERLQEAHKFHFDAM